MGKVKPRVWFLLGLIALTAGCSRQDTERLARIGKRLAAHAEALTADCRASLDSNWNGVGEDVGLGARVWARLRWDRDLEGLPIQVHAARNTIELKGTVRDLAQRRRAVELAESTTGVEKVNDQLHVAER
jgi:hypothetical protein